MLSVKDTIGTITGKQCTVDCSELATVQVQVQKATIQ